jgi:hypothetical protein
MAERFDLACRRGTIIGLDHAFNAITLFRPTYVFEVRHTILC